MKINTKVTEFAKGFAEGFVNSPKDPMTHITAGIAAVNSVADKDYNSLKDTFNEVAAAYLWCGIVDGAYTGLEKIMPKNITDVESD